MPEPGVFTGLLAAAAATAFTGMGWLALAMPVHAAQAWRQSPGRRGLQTLRWLGGASVLVSLGLCLRADHATMAVLVWTMLLAASALAVAFTLSLRPRALALLVPWQRAAGDAPDGDGAG